MVWRFYAGSLALWICGGPNPGLLHPNEQERSSGTPVLPGLGYGRAVGAKQGLRQKQIPCGNGNRNATASTKAGAIANTGISPLLLRLRSGLDLDDRVVGCEEPATTEASLLGERFERCAGVGGVAGPSTAGFALRSG